MLNALATAASSRPKRLLLWAFAAFVLAGVIGAPAAGSLKAKNPFADPSSPSARAEQMIKKATGVEIDPGVLAVVPAPPGSPRVQAVARAIGQVPGVATVSAPTPGAPSPLVSVDGKSSVVAATLRDGPDPETVVSGIQKAVKDQPGVKLGGGDVAAVQVGQQAIKDLGLAEALAFPLLAVIALLVFRGRAALLPLATGGLAVLGAFLVLRLVNMALPLSVFALNLVIGLGLGLAVDYSLFLVWRFRDELHRGADPAAAVHTAVTSTGRTIVFSALTVAAAMATLTVFPLRFLVSMGIGGAAVALIAAGSALLLVPPLLMVMAPRLAKTKVPDVRTGRWYRLAQAVMRRPALIAVVTAAGLLVVASPTPGVHWSGIDATVLPTSQSARVVQDLLDRQFPQLHGEQTILVAATAPASTAKPLAGYAAHLRAVPGVASVSSPTMVAPGLWVIKAASPYAGISAAGQRTVSDIRSLAAPAPVLVGGEAADTLDLRGAIAGHAPVALIVLALLIMLLLWTMTGSVVLPVKALMMNALTVAAATGILVFIFQDGRFTGLLSYTSQGGIEQTDFLVLVALVFALSTDYGVFLLDRIAEARVTSRDERQAVAAGLERTGRLVTAAAIMLAVAIGAFSTSKVVFLKEIGIGTAAAVLIDAFVIRALLVPAVMALLGRWNWWSPLSLQRLHARITHRRHTTTRTLTGFLANDEGPVMKPEDRPRVEA
jgi:RND superfamily putative drug exporter